MIFDKRKVQFSRHLRDRVEERLGRAWSGKEIDRLIRTSHVLLETERHVYLYNPEQNIRFPCIKDGETWVIKSVIVKGMLMEAQE
jgi:hypothetical protein